MSEIKQDTSATRAASDYDPSKYSMVDADSNCQSTVTVGPEDHLVLRTSGADDQRETNEGPGKALA